MKTFSANEQTIKRDWFIVDATDLVLGRMSSQLASRLRGKHKPEYTPHMDAGDYIVVVNAEKVRVTGRKFTDKMYWRHTGHIGGIKGVCFDKMQAEKPEEIIRLAVKGMLPRGPLGRAMLKKLKIYAGEEHPHTAQVPQALEL